MLPLRIEVIDREYAAILAAKTPAERIGMVAEANRVARQLVAAGVRDRNPGWTEEQIAAEVVRRMIDGAR